MTSKISNSLIVDKSSVVSTGNVIYILNDQDQHPQSIEHDQHLPQQGEHDQQENGVYQILHDVTNGGNQEEGNIYQIIETSDETIVGDEDGKEYTETITIVSEDNDVLGEEIIHVANEVDDSGGGPVTFMQVEQLDIVCQF